MARVEALLLWHNPWATARLWAGGLYAIVCATQLVAGGRAREVWCGACAGWGREAVVPRFPACAGGGRLGLWALGPPRRNASEVAWCQRWHR